MRCLVVVVALAALAALAQPALANHKNDFLLYECCVAKFWGEDAPCSSLCTEHSAKVTNLKAEVHKNNDESNEDWIKDHLAEAHVQDEDGDFVNDVFEIDEAHHSSDLLVSNEHGKKGHKNKNSFLETAARIEAGLKNPYVSALWPKAIIPVKYDASVNDAATGDGATARAKFDASMADWGKKTCLQFVPDPTNADAVIMKGTTTGSGARVGTGAKGRECKVTMTSAKKSFLHELGHVIGFMHTNTRSDAESGDFVKFDVPECSAMLLDPASPYIACALDSSGQIKDQFAAWRATERAECDNDETYVVDKYLKGKYGVPGTTYDKTNATQKTECEQAVCVKLWLTQFDYPARDPPLPNAGPYDCSNVMHYPRPMRCLQDLTNCAGKPAPGSAGLTADDAKAVNEIYGCTCHDVTLPFASAEKTDHICHHPDWTLAEFKRFSAEQGGSPDADPFAADEYEVHVGDAKKTGEVKTWGLAADSTIVIKKVEADGAAPSSVPEVGTPEE